MRSQSCPKAPSDLRKARIAKGLTRQQLASRARLPFSTLVRCEQRGVLPAMSDARSRLLAALGIE